VVIQCTELSTSAWWTSNFYQCGDSKSQILELSDRIVTSVKIDHKNKPSNIYQKRINADIDSFWHHDVVMIYFPQKLNDFFANLIAISIEKAKLRKITEEDLKPFDKLIKLFLRFNEIEVLGANLFANNLKLQRINIEDNKIVHVDSSVFANLKDLKFLDFDDNKCHSGSADDNRFKVLMLILDIQLNCFQVDQLKN
jgi:hypothetical protein